MDDERNGLAWELLGDGATYERHLDEAALMVIPGETLDKPDAVRAMEASPGWDEVSLGEEAVRELGDGAALLTYVFRGRRGESRYQARLSSAYVRDGEEWKLAFHQHTPDPEAV
jgi:hypothetical protein